ncbi:MAG: hypothetical protein M3Q10_08295 [Chloroflexota bacterium]|nr:hypothetical protein [Chloroflexota bacterium]
MVTTDWQLEELARQEEAERRERGMEILTDAFFREAWKSDRISVDVDEPLVFATRSLLHIRGEIEGYSTDFWYEMGDGGNRLYANVNHWLPDWQDYLVRVMATANELADEAPCACGCGGPIH